MLKFVYVNLKNKVIGEKSMKKKHKKQLTKLLVSLILMLVVTIAGYFRSTFGEEQILANPRNRSNVRGTRSII